MIHNTFCFTFCGNANLSHSVCIRFLDAAQLALEVDADLEVKVPDVPLVGLHGEGSGHLLPLLAGQIVLQIEHRLEENKAQLLIAAFFSFYFNKTANCKHLWPEKGDVV